MKNRIFRFLASCLTKAPVAVPGIGEVSVGTRLRHRQLGEGVVKVIVPGDVVRVVVQLDDGGEEPFALLPDYFEPLSK